MAGRSVRMISALEWLMFVEVAFPLSPAFFRRESGR